MRIHIFQGETLLAALQRLQVHIDAPCNGNGTCGKCKADIYGIGTVNACQFKEPGTYEVTIPKQPEFHVVTFHAAMDEGTNGDATLESVAVVDLGTTTVAVRLFENGQHTDTAFVNPQRCYGADVMSRIRAAVEGREAELQKLIADSLKKAIGSAKHIIISGNTVMQHILQGLPCEGLGQAPFHPADISLHRVNGEKLGLAGDINTAQDSTITFLPGISTYVGADIVSGIYALDIARNKEVTLLVDLGTNGEMALGNRDKILVTSASAGPAFEGSELAQRIHGSGIMRLLHEMLEAGIMDETGYIVDSTEIINKAKPESFIKADFLTELEKSAERKDSADRKELTDQSVHESFTSDITQDEVRDIQMAKAAIHAGVQILLKEYGISPEQVDKIYLAGGMGYYLDPEDALAIGLLPEEFRGRIVAAGNTSLQGAVRYASQLEEAAKHGNIAKKPQDCTTDATPSSADSTNKATSVNTNNTAPASVNSTIPASAINTIPASTDRAVPDGINSAAPAQALTHIVDISQEIILADNPIFEELYLDSMNFDITREHGQGPVQ